MYEALDDRLGVALCRESLGWTVILRGDHAAALSYFEEGLRIQQELGNPRLVERAKVAVCQALVAVGDVEKAEPMAREILAVALESGDARNTHFAYHFWADCCLYREEGMEAERLYAESLRAALAYGDEAEATFEGTPSSAAGHRRRVQGGQWPTAGGLAGSGYVRRSGRGAGAARPRDRAFHP